MKAIIGMSGIKQQLVAAQQHAQTGPPGQQAPWLRPVLLFGPHGVGKSALAKAQASEAAAATQPPAPTAIARAATFSSRPGSAVAHAAAGCGSNKGTVSGLLPSSGCCYYVDVARLFAEHGNQSDKVIQALFRVRSVQKYSR
jgi:DNA replication protein DnaC